MLGTQHGPVRVFLPSTLDARRHSRLAISSGEPLHRACTHQQCWRRWVRGATCVLEPVTYIGQLSLCARGGGGLKQTVPRHQARAWSSPVRAARLRKDAHCPQDRQAADRCRALSRRCLEGARPPPLSPRRALPQRHSTAPPTSVANKSTCSQARHDMLTNKSIR